MPWFVVWQPPATPPPPHLVPDVPLGLLALVRELGSEGDLVHLALLHLLLRRLLDPLELLLQGRFERGVRLRFEEGRLLKEV